MHILFVDDIEDTRELYSFIFEREGFTMAIASDGMEALKAIQNSEQPFDIVVMDIDMPQVNGWQAVGAIRELPQGQASADYLIYSAFLGSACAVS